MDHKFIIVGGNPFKVSRCANGIERFLGIKVYDGDVLINQEDEEKLIDDVVSREQWIIKTQYNRILSAAAESVEMIVFMDYPQYRNILDCLLRLNFKALKRVMTYRQIKRSWMINRLNQFGTEKRIIMIRNNRELKSFLKLIQTKKAV